jgi:molybdate transport system regulatory protein
MGSIAAAARSMKLGYRNAWLWIDSMNKLAPEPLVVKEAGGEKGGYARVTEAGLKAIEQYKELRDKFLELLDSVE